jgi:hypothetical protein
MPSKRAQERRTAVAVLARSAAMALELRASLALHVKVVLNNRTAKCNGCCAGWFIDGETLAVTRCDDCAVLNGYADHIDDAMIALLPEAYAAHREARDNGAVGNHPDLETLEGR